MTLQEVIDKLVKLSKKSRLFQDHITKVEIEYGDDDLILTIKEKKQKGEQNDS